MLGEIKNIAPISQAWLFTVEIFVHQEVFAHQKVFAHLDAFVYLDVLV